MTWENVFEIQPFPWWGGAAPGWNAPPLLFPPPFKCTFLPTYLIPSLVRVTEGWLYKDLLMHYPTASLWRVNSSWECCGFCSESNLGNLLGLFWWRVNFPGASPLHCSPSLNIPEHAQPLLQTQSINLQANAWPLNHPEDPKQTTVQIAPRDHVPFPPKMLGF